jgi:hypothetical protein
MCQIRILLLVVILLLFFWGSNPVLCTVRQVFYH